MNLKFDIHKKENGTGKKDCWSFQIKHFSELIVNMDVLFYSSNTYFHHQLKLQNVILL